MKIYGEGIATISESGQILEIYFPNIEFGEQKTDYKTLHINSGTQEIIKFEWTKNDLDKPINKISDAYFKLHLISNKFVLCLLISILLG